MRPYANTRTITGTVYRCHQQALVHMVCAAIVTFIAQLFMMLRIYAMSGRKAYILYGLSTWILFQTLFSIVYAVLVGTRKNCNPAIPLFEDHLLNSVKWPLIS